MYKGVKGILLNIEWQKCFIQKIYPSSPRGDMKSLMIWILVSKINYKIETLTHIIRHITIHMNT